MQQDNVCNGEQLDVAESLALYVPVGTVSKYIHCVPKKVTPK